MNGGSSDAGFNSNRMADSTRMIDDTKVVFATFESVVDAMQNAGIVTKIADLLGNRAKDVSETAMDILDKYFPELN